MVFDPGRFRKLETEITQTLDGKRPLKDLPYYIYLYSPRDEAEAIENFTNLASRLDQKHSAETIWLSEILTHTIKRLGLDTPGGREIEREHRDEVNRDLCRVLPEEITSSLKERLRDKERDHCAILLRYGSLLPFVHLKSLLPSIEGVVHSTLVIPYPGEKVGQPLGLDPAEVGGYYRAKVM